MTSQRADTAPRAWVDVDLGALRRNGAAAARIACVPLLPMIKADAYGLGALAAVRALDPLDPWGYGVATVAEGRELREAGVRRPLVVFSPLLPDELPLARALSLTPVLGDPRTIAAWEAAGAGAWHLGIDTGMARAGVRWDAIGALAELLRRVPPEGACTHFHSAELDDGSRERQERRFEQAVAALPSRPALLHAENSAALVRVPGSRWSLVRPGVFLYGVGSGASAAPEGVVAVRGRVAEVRVVHDGEPVSYLATWRARGARRVATVPLGYADGYRRALGNRGTALVGARPAPVTGLVTMDMTMIDVTDIPCDVGDVATFIGRDGDAELSVEAVAGAAELSPYELLTGLRQRLPRRYAEAA